MIAWYMHRGQEMVPIPIALYDEDEEDWFIPAQAYDAGLNIVRKILRANPELI